LEIKCYNSWVLIIEARFCWQQFSIMCSGTRYVLYQFKCNAYVTANVTYSLSEKQNRYNQLFMHSVNNGQKIRKTGMIQYCTSKYKTVHDREANGFYGWNMQLNSAFKISILYINNSSGGFIIEQKTRW